jgi:hypothetical protein
MLINVFEVGPEENSFVGQIEMEQMPQLQEHLFISGQDYIVVRRSTFTRLHKADQIHKPAGYELHVKRNF